jgi:hypothetical protein
VKGQSGNPSGRPKHKHIKDALLEELYKKPRVNSKTTNFELAISRLVGLFISGDLKAGKLVLAYAYGLPTRNAELPIRREAERIAAQLGLEVEAVLREAEPL